MHDAYMEHDEYVVFGSMCSRAQVSSITTTFTWSSVHSPKTKRLTSTTGPAFSASGLALVVIEYSLWSVGIAVPVQNHLLTC